MRNPPLIGIVGVCASGKSTLTSALIQLGYSCRHIAQEHSYVQDMWKRLTNPDILIFLEVSYQVTKIRKKLNWSFSEYQEQMIRLRHAHDSAQIIIETDELSVYELVEKVKEEINLILKNNS